LEVEVLNVLNPQDPSLLGEGTRILRQLFPRFDASTALSLSLSLNSNSIRGEVRLQGIITGHETLLDELKLKFYELDGFKKAHEGKLSSASESDMKRALLQVEKANKKNSILQSRYNEISEKNLQLTTESERLTKEVASLKEKAASSKGSDETTMKQLKHRNEELLVKLNDSATEMSILANQFNIISDSKVKLQEEFNEMKETAERSLQSSMKSSQEEINKLRIELAKVQKSFSSNGENVKSLQEEINLLKAQKAMNSSSSFSGSGSSSNASVATSASSSAIITHPAIPSHLSAVLSSSASSSINEEQIKQLKEEYFQSLKVIDELSSSLTRFTKRVASFPSSVIIAARTRPPTQEELVAGGGLIIENTAGKEGGTVNVFNRKDNNWNVYDLDYHWPYEINQKLMFSDGIAPFLSSIIPNPFELASLPLNAKGQPLYPSSSSSSLAFSLSNHFGIICRGESGSGKSFTAFGDDHHVGIAFHAIDSIFSSLSSYQSAVKKELELSYKHYRNLPSDLCYSFSVSLSLIEIIGDSIYSYANDHPSSDGTRIDSSKISYDAVNNRVVLESMKTEGKTIGNVKEGFNVLASSLKKSYRKSNSRENATLILELTISVSYLPDRDPFISKFTLVELASTNLNTKDKNVLALDSLYSAVASSASSASSSPLPPSSPFPPPSSSSPSSPSSANRLSNSHQNQQHLPFDSSKLTKILQPLFHPNNRHMMIYHFSPSVLSYETILADLTFSRKLRNALIPSFSSIRQPTAKELKDLEKQINSLIVEVKETKRKNEIAEKGLIETRTLAEELVKQLNDGNKLLLQRYLEEKDLAKQLKHDLSLTQRNLKKAIGETQEQRKINERLVKLVKGLEDERSSLNALIHE
jgi:hypothetical protein